MADGGFPSGFYRSTGCIEESDMHAIGSVVSVNYQFFERQVKFEFTSKGWMMCQVYVSSVISAHRHVCRETEPDEKFDRCGEPSVWKLFVTVVSSTRIIRIQSTRLIKIITRSTRYLQNVDRKRLNRRSGEMQFANDGSFARNWRYTSVGTRRRDVERN